MVSAIGLHGTLLAGASAVLLPRFNEDQVLDAAREHSASLFFGVPTMYSRLAASGRARELAALRLCVSGSAPLPGELHARLAEEGTQVLERYGMTETLMNVANPYDGERRAGTVGYSASRRRGPARRTGLHGRDPASRPERVSGLLESAGRDPRGIHRRRLVPQRRRRHLRRRRLPAHRRTQQGADHLRRVQRLPTRDRRRAARTSRRRRGGGGGDAVCRVGRGVTAVVVTARPVDEQELLDFAAKTSLAPYKRPRLCGSWTLCRGTRSGRCSARSCDGRRRKRTRTYEVLSVLSRHSQRRMSGSGAWTSPTSRRGRPSRRHPP